MKTLGIWIEESRVSQARCPVGIAGFRTGSGRAFLFYRRDTNIIHFSYLIFLSLTFCHSNTMHVATCRLMLQRNLIMENRGTSGTTRLC